MVADALQALGDREREVVHFATGCMTDTAGRSWKSGNFCHSRETVRQIEKRAFGQLRSLPDSHRSPNSCCPDCRTFVK